MAQILLKKVEEHVFRKVNIVPLGDSGFFENSSGGSLWAFGEALHKKWSFPLKISSVNVTKSTENFIFCEVKMNDARSKVIVEVNEVVVQVVVLMGVWIKVKRIYEEMKVEKMILVKRVCEQLILIGNVQSEQLLGMK